MNFGKKWCYFITNRDYSEYIFNFYKDYNIETCLWFKIHHLMENIQFQIITFLYHTKLYKNQMIESLFIKLIFFDIKHILIHKGANS